MHRRICIPFQIDWSRVRIINTSNRTKLSTIRVVDFNAWTDGSALRGRWMAAQNKIVKISSHKALLVTNKQTVKQTSKSENISTCSINHNSAEGIIDDIVHRLIKMWNVSWLKSPIPTSGQKKTDWSIWYILHNPRNRSAYWHGLQLNTFTVNTVAPPRSVVIERTRGFCVWKDRDRPKRRWTDYIEDCQSRTVAECTRIVRDRSHCGSSIHQNGCRPSAMKWCSSMVERRSLTGELSVTCIWPTVEG